MSDETDEAVCEHETCPECGGAIWPEPPDVELVIPARYPETRPTRVWARSPEVAVQWADALWHPVGRWR